MDVLVYFYDVEIDSHSTNSVGRLVADMIFHIEQNHSVTFFSQDQNYKDDKIRTKPILVKTGFYKKLKRKIFNTLPGTNRITVFNLKKQAFREKILTIQKKQDCILVLSLDEVTFLREHFPKAQIIYWMHNVSALYKKEFLCNANKADHFVSPSRTSYRLLLQKLEPLALSAKFHFMPNWCADFFMQKSQSLITELKAKHSIAEDEMIFIFSGSDLKLKGRSIVESAIEKLENIIHQKLVFIFAGGRMNHTIHHASNIRIITLGIIAPKELAAYYQIADFGLIPSLAYDHCPLSLLEMIHCNILPIVSDIGGIKEIVSDSYPFLIQDPHEVHKWVESIFHMISLQDQQRNLFLKNLQDEVMRIYKKENAFLVMDEILN